jgi:hypothetical protein
MKLKRKPVLPPSDLADIMPQMRDLLVRNMENGRLTQAAVGLSEERRQRCVAAIDEMVMQLGTARRVIETVGQLVAQQRVSHHTEVGPTDVLCQAY